MENIYYHPEKHNLTVFDEVETAGSYEFDTTVIWKDKDNNLYWAHDSGCSCPIPFEGYKTIKDLSTLTKDNFYNFEIHLKNQYNISNTQFNDCIVLVKKHLNL